MRIIICFGKELEYSPEKLVPLYGLGDIITRIAEAAACAANKAAASEHKLAEMIITIDKHTVIPEEEFRRLLRSSLDNNDRMEHRVTYHDTDVYDHAGGCVEDEDDYDHDYFDEYRAIEDRLLDNLDQCPQWKSRPAGGTNYEPEKSTQE